MVKAKPESKQEIKRSWKNLVLPFTVLVLAATVLWLVIEKTEVHETLCQIVAFDQEEMVVAAKCISR